MNAEPRPVRAWPAYAVGIAGCFLIVAGLVWAMKHYLQAPPLGEDRVALRTKALAELRGAEHQALTTAGWVDQNKGVVRLRIEDAMQWVEREWKHPAAARSNLMARLEKATAVPPKPPEKPSEFE